VQKKNIINVTKTFFPSFKEYKKYLLKIWKNGWITNHGPLACRLENILKKYLGVKHLFFVSNGTVALEISIRALELKGEIITTPFSYVATTSSIVWMNCKPVFADINPDTLCISPDEIQKKITKKTSAILATHVYGNPCDIEGIENIADKFGLKIIYDAAHCFGVKYNDHSVLNEGSISTLSFHATKLFHTAEGGAIITNNAETACKISYLRNFGHKGLEAFWGLGINGKNSELHAAMGLCVLPQVKKLIISRKSQTELYNKLLLDKTNRLITPQKNNRTEYNFSYYPVIFESEKILIKVRTALNKQNVFPRRYFYPSLTDLNYINSPTLPVSSDISKRILCLPLYHGLKLNDIKKISELIKENI